MTQMITCHHLWLGSQLLSRLKVVSREKAVEVAVVKVLCNTVELEGPHLWLSFLVLLFLILMRITSPHHLLCIIFLCRYSIDESKEIRCFKY